MRFAHLCINEKKSHHRHCSGQPVAHLWLDAADILKRINEPRLSLFTETSSTSDPDRTFPQDVAISAARTQETFAASPPTSAS
jgi:hypothetical protein